MLSVESLADYYSDPVVRTRILEYCGTTGERSSTCVFLAAMDGREGPHANWDSAPRYPLDDLDSLLADGADIARSTWDTGRLLVHLDIDYQNVDEAGEAYRHPVEVFFKLEPTYEATQQVLMQYDLPLFPLLTGRGYHFTGEVPLDAAVVQRIAALVPEPPVWVGRGVDVRRVPGVTADISPPHGRAYTGAGLLCEFLAHEILKRARRRSGIPVVLNGTVVGNGVIGRECISIDLSYAGDPLDVRHIRVAFGAYQKHRFRPDIFGNRVALERPPFIAIPRSDQPLHGLVMHSREPRHAVRAARAQSAQMPIVTEGISRVLQGYEASRLREFHASFYRTPVKRGQAMDDAFESLNLASFPACITSALQEPNDQLLRPAVIQHVTRFLMAAGVKPRDIAAIVHSRYAKDFGWGDRWSRLDAETRAEFDVRVFAGLIADGLDRGIDFNCRSAQEKELCPGGTCHHDLRVDRANLLSGARA